MKKSRGNPGERSGRGSWRSKNTLTGKSAHVRKALAIPNESPACGLFADRLVQSKNNPIGSTANIVGDTNENFHQTPFPSLLALGASLLCLASVHATQLTWDADPLTANPQDGPGIWDSTTNTWWDGAANVVWNNATPDSAVFGAGSGAAGTISNAVAITVGNITFNAAGSGTYTITATTANPVTLSGTPTINANTNAALNVVLAGTSFTKEGTGQLSLRPGANNTYTGTTIVNNGILALNSSTANRVLIPGDLIINNTTVTNTGSSGPVADTSTVTVNGTSTYASGSEIMGALVLAGGTVIQNSTKTLNI